MAHATRKQVWDRLTGALLGTVVHIEGDQITYYKGLGHSTFYTISACWVYVWEGTASRSHRSLGTSASG